MASSPGEWAAPLAWPGLVTAGDGHGGNGPGAARAGVGAPVSTLGWVLLVGVSAWLLLSAFTALVLSRLARGNRVTTLDVLRAQHGLGTEGERLSPEDVLRRTETGPASRPADGDLPAPRDGAHDEAERSSERRPGER